MLPLVPRPRALPSKPRSRLWSPTGAQSMCTSPRTRRTGGSRAGASGSARRRAPRRRPGRGCRAGRGDAAARRHGRAHGSLPGVGVPERVLRVLPRPRACRYNGHGHGSPRRLSHRSRPDVAAEPRLACGGDEDAAVHAHVPHPSRGSLERRNACQRRDFVFTHKTSRSDGVSHTGTRTTWSGSPTFARSIADREGGAPRALRRLAPAIPVRAPGACARRRRFRHGVERGINDPERAPDRKRAFPGAELGSRPRDHVVRNPRYWGPTGVSRPARVPIPAPRTEAIEGLRQGELDLVHGMRVSAGQARAFRQLKGISVQSDPGLLGGPRFSRSPSGRSSAWRKAGAPGDRACDRQRPLSSRRTSPRSTVAARGATAPSSPPSAATTGRTGAATVTTRPSRTACSSGPVAASDRRRYLRLPWRKALLARVHDRRRRRPRGGTADLDGTAAARRRRAHPTVRAVRAAVRTWGGAATSISYSPPGARNPTSGEMNTILKCGGTPELDRLLPAPRHPGHRRGGPGTRP